MVRRRIIAWIINTISTQQHPSLGAAFCNASIFSTKDNCCSIWTSEEEGTLPQRGPLGFRFPAPPTPPLPSRPQWIRITRYDPKSNHKKPTSRPAFKTQNSGLKTHSYPISILISTPLGKLRVCRLSTLLKVVSDKSIRRRCVRISN
ncbi:MAG: hypothetical protein JWM56_1180 [Candidatus Peribacteria bacterium]|nr:hypothetical protein [Candidatus Peribacteria bacterium]